MTSGSNNIFIGLFTASTSGGAEFGVSSGSQNILIGSGAGFNSTTQRDNAIGIGQDVIVNASNIAVIGNASETDVYLGSTTPAAALHALSTESTRSIGATSTDGVIARNTTAAAAGAQQWSPRIRLTGQGWKTDATAASQAVDWILENQPVQGTANPTTNLVVSSQINAGGYNARFTFGDTGNLTIVGDLTLRHPVGAGTGPSLDTGCGTGTLATGSSDMAGKITTNTTGACTIVLTFGTAWGRAPSCAVNNETTANLSRSTTTTTTATLSGTTVTGDVWSYHCIGY
jgi:hypothetical protein